ncbi:hypothetical protein D3C87_1359220 [compost metagenome]
MAIGSFDLCDFEHVLEVLNVRIHVNTVDPIGHIRRDRLQRHVARVVLDGDVFHISHFFVDVLDSAVMVPDIAHRNTPYRKGTQPCMAQIAYQSD